MGSPAPPTPVYEFLVPADNMSPVVDKGDPATMLAPSATDMRGLPLPYNGRVDMGACEFGRFAPTADFPAQWMTPMNTVLRVPAAELLTTPESDGSNSAPFDGLFFDGDDDRMTLSFGSMPSATSDLGTAVLGDDGALKFTPAWNKVGLATFSLVAKDSTGLDSEDTPARVNITGGWLIDGWWVWLRLCRPCCQAHPETNNHPFIACPGALSPQLADPAITKMQLTVTGCTAAGVRAEFGVAAGLLQTVLKPTKSLNPRLKDTGIPSTIRLEVFRIGRQDQREEVVKEYRFSLPAGIKAAKERRFGPYGGCAGCKRCMDAMQFSCYERYFMRVKARGSKKFRESGWSAVFMYTPDCNDAARLCYPRPSDR
jgi:hypothetical protein